ncbi:uncharacterized protein BXZ73DRAFT_99089 [Epithele typhae]|uniref:uncharacterized protein n=1 Tax=Epithele typhae TaxID=378194 RepID=UPI0020089603|nr:uncharacterized protein BXZ73DRAFT_99089 [Epithele typhae]KAH9940088.1 hypothetical protein BXZ73DRAFT_99089 [Epithele typhae]
MSPKRTATGTVLDPDAPIGGDRLSVRDQFDTSKDLRQMLTYVSGDATNANPFEKGGVIFRVGDLVVVQNFRDDGPGAGDKQMPGAWLGILLDYSFGGNPCNDGIVHGGVGGRVDAFAVAWCYSKFDVEQLLDAKIPQHEIVEPTLGDAHGRLYKTFLSDEVPGNVRFICTEVEWIKAKYLQGVASPEDIGNGMNSARTVTVPFKGPWLDVTATVEGAEEVHHVVVKVHADINLPMGFVKEEGAEGAVKEEETEGDVKEEETEGNVKEEDD